MTPLIGEMHGYYIVVQCCMRWVTVVSKQTCVKKDFTFD